MGQILLRFFIFLFMLYCPAFALQKGVIEYSIPIDYSLIDEKSLNDHAEILFSEYNSSTDEILKKTLLFELLSDYSILSKINKDNPLYFTRLGIVYDKLGKEKWAKSNFCRGSNLVPNYAYAFYSFGNYFFERNEYRKALKEYMRAYQYGFDKHYENLYQIGIIYEKLGDFTLAIKYFKLAQVCKDSEELTKKILLLEEMLKNNSLYNQKRGVIYE